MSGIDNDSFNGGPGKNDLYDNDGQTRESPPGTVVLNPTKLERSPLPTYQANGSLESNPNSNSKHPPLQANGNGNLETMVECEDSSKVNSNQVEQLEYDSLMQAKRDRDPLTICKWMTNRPKTWFGKFGQNHVLHVYFK